MSSTASGPLDRIPAWARHLILVLAPPLLGYLSSDVIPALQSRPGVTILAAAVLQALVLFGTTLTRQYGVGSSKADAGV